MFAHAADAIVSILAVPLGDELVPDPNGVTWPGGQ
jgi:hypothetical protein